MSHNYSNLSQEFAELPTFVSIAYLYIVPMLSSFGFFLNVMCLAVLVQPILNGDMYKLLIVKTIVQIVVLSISATSPIAHCQSCTKSRTLAIQIYRLYLLKIANNIILSYSTLIEIAISYHTFFILRKDNLIRVSFRSFLTLILILGFFVNMPYFFVQRIDSKSSTPNIYILTNTKFTESSLSKLYILSLNFVQSLLTLVIMIILNILIRSEFKIYLRRKILLSSVKINWTDINNYIYSNNNNIAKYIKDTTSLDEYNMNSINSQTDSTVEFMNTKARKITHAERRFTRMILTTSLIYTFTRLISFIEITIKQVFLLRGTSIYSFNSYLTVISYISFSVYFGSNLFTYLMYNKMFRQCFRRLYHI
jgi:hypothetical protein